MRAGRLCTAFILHRVVTVTSVAEYACKKVNLLHCVVTVTSVAEYVRKKGDLLHRVVTVTSVAEYTRKKGNSLHRGFNPVMKNKRSARIPTRAVRKMMPLRAFRMWGARLASES